MLYFKCLVVLLFIESKVGLTRNLLEKNCTLQPGTDVDVVCKRLSDCPFAERFRETNAFFPSMCGYENSDFRVCCLVRKPGLTSKKMCRKYASLVYEEMESPTMLAYASPIKVYKCGQGNAGLIIGGKVTERREFPHMVLIGLTRNNSNHIAWNCGGTMLSEFYILTAAHCLNDSQHGVATHAKLAITNRDDGIFNNYTISERIPHPKYNKSLQHHDIALLKLERPAKFSPYARPACLYTESGRPPQKGIVTGWGQSEMNNRNSRSNNLLKLELEIFNYTYCNASYRRFVENTLTGAIMENLQFCAGPPNWREEKDACPGDSGGPLQIFHRGDDLDCMYDVVGIVSFGKTCPSSAGIYVNVSSYVGWIEDIVWPYLP